MNFVQQFRTKEGLPLPIPKCKSASEHTFSLLKDCGLHLRNPVDEFENVAVAQAFVCLLSNAITEVVKEVK